MDVKVWSLGKPFPEDRGFVRAVIIQDDMNIQVSGHVRLDGIQKPAEFLRTMAAMQLADHPVGLQLQRGEQ